jgi:hypothetical protein
MGNHDFSDKACAAGVKRLRLPLEVDARSDIGDDFVIGKTVSQEIDLPDKISFCLADETRA